MRWIVAALIGAIVVAGGAFVAMWAASEPGRHGDARGRAEAEAWEAKWLDARACLAGGEVRGSGSGSGSGSAASAAQELAMHELREPGWRPQRCAGMVAALRGMRVVDRAEARVEAALRSDAVRDTLELSDALDELELARVAMRSDVGLESAAGVASGLPLAAVIALPGVSSLESPMPIPSANGVVVFGRGPSGGVEVVLATGGEPRIASVREGVWRSTGELGWGALAGADGTKLGVIDEVGELDGARQPLAGRNSVLAAVGTHDDGAVVYASTESKALRVASGGIRELSTAFDEVAYATDPVAQRAAIVWREGTAVRGTVVAGGGARFSEAPIDLATGSRLSNEVCFDAARPWARAGDYLVRFGENDGTPPRPMPTFHLVGCGRDAAVLREKDHDFIVCRGGSAGCASKHVDPLPAGALPFALRGELAFVAIRHGVAMIYTPGAPPRFFVAPGAASATLVFANDAALDVVAGALHGFEIVRIRP